MSVVTPAIVVALCLAASAVSQTPKKNWADAAEYNLGSAASSEQQPESQLELLRRWEAQYPKTEFQRERLASFAFAYMRLGMAEESFARAVQLSKLFPDDWMPLLLIVQIGPKLAAPTDGQVSLVADAASKLRSTSITTPRPSSSFLAPGPVPPHDPESAKVLAFIRDQRRARTTAIPDPDALKNELVRSALDWVQKLRP